MKRVEIEAALDKLGNQVHSKCGTISGTVTEVSFSIGGNINYLLSKEDRNGRRVQTWMNEADLAYVGHRTNTTGVSDEDMNLGSETRIADSLESIAKTQTDGLKTLESIELSVDCLRHK